MSPGPDAVEVVRLLRERGETIATAESLTGGLLCAALVDVPGASDVVAGGIVAYSSEVKVELLGVGRTTIEEVGTVDPVTAVQMAWGAVEQVPGATIGVSTTGVAGPGPSEGHEAGTVYVAVATAHEAHVLDLHLSGDRSRIREATVAAALSYLVATLDPESRESHPAPSR